MARMRTKTPKIISQKKTRSVGFTSLPKRPHDDDVDFDIAGDCFKLYFCKSRAETSISHLVPIYRLLEHLQKGTPFDCTHWPPFMQLTKSHGSTAISQLAPLKFGGHLHVCPCPRVTIHSPPFWQIFLRASLHASCCSSQFLPVYAGKH